MWVKRRGGESKVTSDKQMISRKCRNVNTIGATFYLPLSTFDSLPIRLQKRHPQLGVRVQAVG
jgi:hypothetical protein